MNDQELSEKILEIVTEHNGVTTNDLQRLIEGPIPLARVAKLAYTMAEADKLALEIGDNNIHWFFRIIERKIFLVHAEGLMVKEDTNTYKGGTNYMVTALRQARHLLQGGARRVTIVKDDLGLPLDSDGQDMDEESHLDHEKTCGCTNGCKAWDCSNL